MSNFWNLYPLYIEQPPVVVDRADGVLRRSVGGSHKSAFWAGYDELKGGNYPPPRGSVCASAYRAGVAWKKKVNNGKAEPLPARNA